ncbi:outer membrane protein [Jiella endophytica]|nr:outer membrane protein [Jiella endophytica]
MKASVWMGAAASLAIVSASGGALAADLAPIYDTPIYQDVPEVQPVEIGTGWYLRGDVGYQFKSDLATDYEVTSFDGTTTTSLFRGGYDGLDLGRAPEVSIGAGYKFNEFLRADATVGYWKADVDSADFPGGLSVDSEVKSFEVMANAYVDLGTYAGFTPYVGAGAGTVHVEYQTGCRYAGDDCGSSLDTDIDDLSKWRFAYSLMAGVSYDVSQNLKLDVGYRYLDVDGSDTADVAATDVANGIDYAIHGSDDGFERHTIRAGLRYSLW